MTPASLRPKEAVLVVALKLPGLTFQKDDLQRPTS